MSEALTRCDTSRAAEVRSCTAGPLQAPRGINVTALHYHLSPDWPQRFGGGEPMGAEPRQGVGGAEQNGAEQTVGQDGKMFSDTDG